MTSRLPSTDLYFTHACDDWVARWWRPGPVKALGANSFESDGTMLLVRRDQEALMRRALDWPGRLVYLVDDDIAGAAESGGLPDAYRHKLSIFDKSFHRPLLRRADIVLVPSDPLATLLDADRAIAADIHRIDPYWHLPLADQRHFAKLGRGGTFDIIHLGSGSHAGGLTAIGPAVADLLATHGDVTFTYFGAAAPHALLERHPRARRIPPMGWPRYRRWLARQRFHLGIYPLEATPFDKARSINKLIEHAIVGAVGMYPGDWAPARILGEGAITAPSNLAAWGEALAKAVRMREKLAVLAIEASVSLTRYADPAMQRRLWNQLLCIESA